VDCDGSEGWSTYDPSTPRYLHWASCRWMRRVDSAGSGGWSTYDPQPRYRTYFGLHVDGCDGGWPVMEVKDGVLTIPQPPLLTLCFMSMDATGGGL
jgi:hypothetical protein